MYMGMCICISRPSQYYCEYYCEGRDTIKEFFGETFEYLVFCLVGGRVNKLMTNTSFLINVELVAQRNIATV